MSQVVYCWRCGSAVPSESIDCPSCGLNFGSRPPWRDPLSTVDKLGSAYYSTSSGVSQTTVTDATYSVESFSALFEDTRRKLDILKRKGVPQGVILPFEKGLHEIEKDNEELMGHFEEALKSGDEGKIEDVRAETDRRLLAQIQSLERTALPSAVIEAISTCNLQLRNSNLFEVFKSETKIGDSLHGSCTSSADFVMKIGVFGVLFDVPLDPIRSCLAEYEEDWKSVRLVEAWCQQEGLNVDSSVFETWRRLIRLRNSSFPYHSESPEFIENALLFGESPPIDYERLWDSILRKFLFSILELQRALSSRAQ